MAAAPTGRLLVTLEPAAAGVSSGPLGAAALAGRAEARPAGPRIPQLRLLTVRPKPGRSVAAVAAALRAERGVVRVERERRATPRLVPNDPALSTLEGRRDLPVGTPVQWWAERQGLFAAWDVTQARNATVAVIDSGVDAGHPELAGQIDAAVDNDQVPGHGPATVDEVGHGTHVASMACAAADDGIGIAGAGFGCRLLVYKSDLTDSSVAASIVQATDRGADAINMSFGTTPGAPAPTIIADAVRYAYRRGVVLVSAAADRPIEQQGYPSNVLQPTGTGSALGRGLGLSVTAANFADRKARFAGFGSEVSLAAYGAWDLGPGGPRGLLGDFPSATADLERASPGPPLVRACECRTTFGEDRRYALLQGTSMAAPIVAASAAMVRRLNPDLTAAEIIRLMKETARRPAGAGWGPDLGWGIVNAGAALDAARLLDRRAPDTRVTVSRSRSATLTLRLVGVDTAPDGVVSSGVARFDVFGSVDGSRQRRIARTSRRTLRLKVRRGRRYAFWAVATDRAGNREAEPRRPDARIRLAPAG